MSSGYTPLAAPSAANASAAPGAVPQRPSRVVTDPCDCLFTAADRAKALVAPLLPSRSKTVGYSAGFLFSLGWWVFLDGLTLAVTHAGQGCGDRPNHLPTDPCFVPPVRFEDWVPGIIASLSLIIVNLVDQEALTGDEYGMGGGSDTAYRARAVAFIGVTMGLGAIGGALAILSLKYILTAKVGMALYFGVTIAIQSVLVFVSSMVFWFGRNGESDGSLRI